MKNKIPEQTLYMFVYSQVGKAKTVRVSFLLK